MVKNASIKVNSLVDKLNSLCNDISLKKGDNVVVEFDSCFFMGYVTSDCTDDKSKVNCKIVRKANDKDMIQLKKNNRDSFYALKDAKKISSTLKLDMSFVDVFFSLDRKKLYLYFVSDNRVDFRELAKRMAQKYHTRIEFRQIGVRDKAKKVGGLGPCGLPLCCNRFLTDFNSVSINMAKNQMLSLNPSKINGVCGRLMCCLGYENDTYKNEKKGLPKIGNIIDTQDGKGKVIEIDVFNKICKVELANKSIISVKVGEKDGEIR